MKIVGVDLGGRKAAVAVLDTLTLELKTYVFFGASTLPRSTQLRIVSSHVKTVAEAEGADLVYVEEPIVGRGVRASLEVTQMAGAVLSALDHLSGDTYLVPNKTWKKRTVGNGNADKDQIAEWLKSTHPSYTAQCDGDQDQVDATCIALYGLGQSFIAASLREGIDLLGA